MQKFDLAVGLSAVALVALVLGGLWSLVYKPYCGVLGGYVALGALTGSLLLLSRWYKSLEVVGIGLLLLYLVAMWATFANPASLYDC